MHRNTALRNAGLWILLSLAAGHLTEEQSSTIVDVHNDLRSQVKPSAAFMQKVVRDACDVSPICFFFGSIRLYFNIVFVLHTHSYLVYQHASWIEYCVDLSI